MSDMTLTMTFKAVDEATAVMKQITSAEKDMQASVRAGSEATAAVADTVVANVQRQADAVDRVSAAVSTATATIAKEVAAISGPTHGDRTWGPISWGDETPEQQAIRDEFQNLRDLADQQRMFREAESFENSLIAGLGGPVPDAMADAITPPAPEPPAWSDRTWGPIEWNDDTEVQAAGREEIRQLRASADEAQAAAELQRQLVPLRDTAGEIAEAMDGIGRAGEPAAGGLGAVSGAAELAAPKLRELADAVMNSQGLMNEFGRAFGRVVGSLGSALLITGVEYATSQMIGFVHEALTKEGQIAEALSNHAQIVKEIDQAYRSAADGMSEYEASSASLHAWRAQRNIVELEAAQEAIRGNIAGQGVFNPLYEHVGSNPWDVGGFFGRDLGPLRDPIRSYNSGDIDARELQFQLGDIALTLSDDSEFHKVIEEALEILAPDLEIIEKLEKARRSQEKAEELLARAEEFRTARAADAEAQSVAELDVTVDGAAEAGSELRDVVDLAAEVQPVMAAAASGVTEGTHAFENLDPAAAGAAQSVGASADEIARAGQNAQSTTADLERLKSMMQEVSATRMAITPISAGLSAPPAAANTNMPGFSDGGYTGDMPVDALAGFVHGREFVFDADATAAIGPERLAAIAASPELLDAPAARAMVAAMPMGGGGGPISVTLSAPVTIHGDAPRAGIERDVMDVLERSGRQLAELIDEETRRRERRRYRE